MGADKALVEVGGRTMLELVSAVLGDVTDRVVVAGRDGTVLGLTGLPDPFGGPVGPLAGVAAALREAAETEAESVIVVAVDQPFVRPETLAHLLGRFAGSAVVPAADGTRQVTCAVYPPAWHHQALAELNAGGSIQSLLDRLEHVLVDPDEWTTWDEDGRSWFSVDDAESLVAGLERFGTPPG
jgi:molybdopterin-guanine dinucleotide biosynthesis protein A